MASVMRAKTDFGLSRTSGHVPVLSDHGMSARLQMRETVNFWPCRVANLSPTRGTCALRISMV